MNLKELDLQLELKELVEKTRYIVNEGYFDKEELESFDESLYTPIEYKTSSLFLPFIEVATNQIVFIYVLKDEETVNGCEIIRPYAGTKEEVESVYSKISSKKKTKISHYVALVLFIFSVIILLCALIEGLTSGAFLSFVTFAFYLGPWFCFVGICGFAYVKIK